MLVPLGITEYTPPLILGFHVRSTVPLGLSRAMFVRGTSFTRIKSPQIIILPSSWTARSYQVILVDVPSFISGSVAGEICPATRTGKKKEINNNMAETHAVRCLKDWSPWDSSR